MADLQDQIKIGVDASGVETGVGRVKRSMADMGKAVSDAGKRGGDGFKQMGQGGQEAASNMDSATKRIVNSLQRQIAAAEAGGTATRAYQESIARLRGANLDALQPYLNQLDQANKKTEEAKAKTEALVGTMRGIGGRLVAIAAGFTAAFSFKKFIDETIAAEQAQTQLQAVLKSTGESAGWSSDQLNKMAQGFSRNSIFSADQIKVAETRLLSYTGIVGDQFPRAMQSVIDMSTRMGVEVSSAAEQIGRALDVPSQGLTSLSKQGFRFTDDQKRLVEELESVGRVAEAQGIVLEALESSYGGAGLAARDTFGGALKGLQTTINDLMTGEGAGIEGMTRGVNNLSDALGSEGTKQAFQTFIGWIANVSAAAISGAANLLSFISASNKLGIIAGTDSFGQMKANAAEYSRQLEQLTLRSERYQEAINRGFNVDQNQRNLDKTREMIGRVQKQALEAAQQLKDFANARDGKSGAVDFGAPSETATANAAAAAIAKTDATRAAARAEAISKLLGVNSTYQAELEKTQSALRSGAITQDEYVASLKKLATETWAATDAGKAAAEASKAGTKARDEAAKATQREAEAYGSFISSVQSKIAAIDLELAGGAKLTESQRLQLQLQKMIADGKVKESRAEQEATKALLAGLSAKEDALKLQTEQNKALEESAKAYDTYIKSQQNAVRADVEKNTTLRLEIEAMGLTKRELLALNRSRMDEQIVALQAKHSLLTLAGAREDETKVIREQIKALQDRKELLGQQFEKQEMLDAQQQITEMWTSIDSTAHDVFVNIFEDGAGTFKRLGQTLKSALLDMLYQLTVKRWIINIGASMGATGGIFGEGQGGAGGLFSTASNANSLFSGASLISNWMGTGAGAGMGTLAYGNMIGAMGGDGLGAFMAANGGWGTSGAGALANSAGSAFGGAAAGIGAVAAPLIIGALMERFGNSNERITGAASTRNNTVGVNAGSTSFDMLTGNMPDREALLAELVGMGGTRNAYMEGLNDRGLLQLLARARAQQEMNANLEGDRGIQWGQLIGNGQGTADFYRGEGYANPEALGWWSNDSYTGRADMDQLNVDPAMVQQSRALAQSIVAPMNAMAVALGEKADQFEATVGFAFDPDKGWFSGLAIDRNGANTLNTGKQEFDEQDDAIRAMFRGALDGFSAFDLPDWARTQADQARSAMDALTGDNIGQQAAALYQQAAGGISATFVAIEKMVALFPDFAGASQDAVYALGQLTGGLDNLAASYQSYVGNFYSDSERNALAIKEVGLELDKLGVDTAPRTRAEFRALVEAQDLTTESGRALFAGLMGISEAFASVTPQLFGAGQTLSDAITQGLLGTFDGDNLGAYMAQTVSDGIYNAVAGNFAAQITDILVSGVIEPMVQAAVTGSSISAAVSAETISAMVAQATAVADAAAAILNDPAFRAAMDQIGSAVSGISVPIQRAAPQIRSYTQAVRDSGSVADKAANDAARAAEQMRKAWQSIGDTLMDEVNRIRGVIADTSGQGADYWQAQLAIATAQARAGDQDAAKSLTGISQNLLRAAEQSAGSQLELQRIRAQVAQDLQDTAGYAYGQAGNQVQAPAAPQASGVQAFLAQLGLQLPGFVGASTPSPAPAPTDWTAPPPVFAAPTGSSSRDPELLSEVKALRAAIESNARTDNDLQRRGVRVLERMDTLGMPKERVETPA